MARPKREEETPLTDAELQIMNILWVLGTATVHEVLESLNIEQAKNYAYTTVSTLLRVLEKKGAVSSKKEGRGHKYQTAIAKENYQSKATDHLISNVFQGQKSALIRNLLGSESLSQEELDEIQKVLKEKARK